MDRIQLFKVAVSAFIVRDDKLLILRRSENETFLPGAWEVPGGGIDRDEAIVEGLIRETKEEAGLDISSQKLFGFFEYTDGYDQKTVNLNFICKLLDDSQRPDVSQGEMESAAWVGSADLKDYGFTSDVMRDACIEALRLVKTAEGDS